MAMIRNTHAGANAKGVTLTELLISVAIMGLLVSIGSVFMIGGVRFFRLSSAKAEIQRDARTNIDLINRNLRQAQQSSVVISRYDNSQPPCSMVQFTHVNGTQYSFYQAGNKLYMATGSNPGKKMADNLRNLLFTYPRSDDGTLISVSICFEKATYQGRSKALQLSVEKVRIMN